MAARYGHLINKWTVAAVAALALAVGVLFLWQGSPVQAQDATKINYPENATHAVMAFSARSDDGREITSWSLSGQDAGDFNIDAGRLSFKEPPDFESPIDGNPDATPAVEPDNVYMVTVQSTDTDGNLGTAAVEVTVTNVEETGKVTMPARQPQVGVSFKADLEDPDVVKPGTKQWQWAKSSTASGSYTDIEDAEADAYTPKTGDVGYFLRATVMYEDDHGPGKSQSEVSDFAVRAQPSGRNDPPAFAAATDTREVDENTPAGSAIEDPVAAGDVNGDVLTYTLTGTDASRFDIDRNTGQLMTKSKLDFEATGDDNCSSPNTCEVVVRATDPYGDPEAATADTANSDTITVTINIQDVNEAPGITGPASVSVAENTTADTNIPNASYTPTDLDADDTPPGADGLSLSGPDSDKLNLVSGALQFEEAPNFEKPGDANQDNTYEVTLRVTSGADDRALRGSLDVKVMVTNALEAGTIEFDRPVLRVGTPVTATLKDDDGVKSITGWQWYKGTDDTAANAIDGATSATYTPAHEDIASPGPQLHVVVTYLDRNPDPNVAGADPLVFTRTAEGTTTGGVQAWSYGNKAPEFADGNNDPNDGAQATRMVGENTPGGTNIGTPVQATDDQDTDTDNNNILIYSLEGPDADKFDVKQDDPATAFVSATDQMDEGGQLTVGEDTKLDYETKTTYMVTVKAEDSYGAVGSVDVTITVTDDPNEPPTIAPVSDDATLMSLDLWRAPDDEVGNLTMTFMADTMSYMVDAMNSDESVTVKAIANHMGATVTVNGDAVAADGTAMVYLNVGANTITVMVTAEDGTTEETYTITVTRAASMDATLSALSLSAGTLMPAFAADTMAYTAMVDNSVTSVTVTATAHAEATVSGDGMHSLDVGDNTITVTVTAGDGTTEMTYTITVTRAEPADSNQALVARYDANSNGMIDKAEVIAAINDYLFGGTHALTKEQVIYLINCYLFGC